MLQTVRKEKVDEKNVVVCLVSMFSYRLMVLSLLKKVNLLQFCADHSKKPKQFTYMYLKVIITFFQKVIWVIGV